MPEPPDNRAAAAYPGLDQGLGLLDIVSDAVLIRDLEGRIIFWNEEAERRIGYSRREAVGRLWYELLRTASERPIEELQAEVLAKGSWIGELTHRDSSGRAVKVSSRWRLLRDAEGRPVAVMQSTDEVRRLTIALNDLSRAETELRASENRFRSVFEHSPLAIVRLDAELRILDSNSRLRTMLGATSELAGSTAARYFGPGLETALKDHLAGVETAGSAPSSGVVPSSRIDGTPIWLGWTATSVLGPDNALEYILLMLEDVTAKHAAEQTAMTNLAELERLNALKSDFVGVVSHEFRTALTGIQGFSELIRDGGLDVKEMREFADDINKDALRLNRMITQMLELERIEAGRMTLQLGPVNLNQLIEESVSRARTLSAEHTIETRLDPDLPVIQADSDRLVQVLSNLLSNAVKYSPGGGAVDVTSWQASNQIVVSVADHGVGIPPDSIDRIFERYERYESTPTSRVVGTGLGLPIAKQIVEIHGGRMWVESQVGHGSIFNFALPHGGS